MTNQIENFIVEYEKETHSQEINANKRILNVFVWGLAAIGLLLVLSVFNILTVDNRMVIVSFVLAFLLYIPAFFLLHTGKLSADWIKYYLLAQLCILCGIIMSILSYHAVLLSIFPLLYAIQYREKKIIWFTFSFSLLIMAASSFIGYYFGICDLNVFLEGHFNYSRHLSSVTEGLLLIPLNESPVLFILSHILLPNAVILFLLAIILQYTVISNTRDSLRIAQLTYYKDTDTNTKVYNKNKYEEMITKYYPGVDRLAIIFFDLNHLKKVNDELGHAMGDYIIQTLADVVNQQSGDFRHVYRIGGDEFVMVIESPSQGEAELIIANVKEALALHNETGPVAISTAAGFAYGKGCDILEVVKAADERMYENKKFIKSQGQ